MPDIEEMDDNLTPVSSDGEALDAVTETPEGEQDTDANSSTATDDEGLLGVVRDVVKDRPKSDAASSADGSETGNDAGDAASQNGQDNENYTDVPFHKHPRFQALITERNGFREDAGRYQNVVKYLDENNLTSEEAANALHTFARAKVDPAGAFAELKPWLQQLLIAAGEVLPDDLQARVTKGELTSEAAMEISRERAKSTSLTNRQSFDQQRAARRTAADQATALVQTVTDWEADRRKKDPNFAAKYPLLQREVAFIQQQEGKPKDADGVKAQLKKAYDAVNKTFRPPAAQASNASANRKPATKPVTGGNVTGSVRETPKSTLDIVRANRRRTA